MRAQIESSLRRLHQPPDTVQSERPRASDFDLTPRFTPEPQNLTAAAVLVPLVERPDGLTVLLTQRTQHLRDHPGQISFPGGRAEEHDDGPAGTALRETEEEIGLTPNFIELAGYLDNYETGTAFLVTPVVGFVTPGFTLAIDNVEVAETFEVPLSFIMKTENRRTESRIARGTRRHYYVFEYEDRYIWGATAGMLVNLLRRIAGELGR